MSLKCIQTRVSAIIALALSAGVASADEAALYDAPAPEDAAYVRVLSGYTEIQDAVAFGGVELPANDLAPDTYAVISASELSGVNAGSYHSIVPSQHGAVVIPEPDRDTATKVHLILLNTGAEPVRLIVAGQGMEVIGALETGAAASRAVNPIDVALAVERVSDGERLGVFDVSLSRGQNLTFVAGDLSARMIENAFGPVLTLN